MEQPENLAQATQGGIPVWGIMVEDEKKEHSLLVLEKESAEAAVAEVNALGWTAGKRIMNVHPFTIAAAEKLKIIIDGTA